MEYEKETNIGIVARLNAFTATSISTPTAVQILARLVLISEALRKHLVRMIYSLLLIMSVFMVSDFAYR